MQFAIAKIFNLLVPVLTWCVDTGTVQKKKKNLPGYSNRHMLILTDRSGPLPIHYYDVPGLLLVGVHSASGFTGIIYLLPDCQKKKKKQL